MALFKVYEDDVVVWDMSAIRTEHNVIGEIEPGMLVAVNRDESIQAYNGGGKRPYGWKGQKPEMVIRSPKLVVLAHLAPGVSVEIGDVLVAGPNGTVTKGEGFEVGIAEQTVEASAGVQRILVRSLV